MAKIKLRHNLIILIIANFFSQSLALSRAVKDEKKNFERFEKLSPLVSVMWQVDFKTEMVTFEVTGETLGYIGLGLSLNGNMEGADIVIGGVHPNQTFYFQDYHGTGYVMPTLDTKQDWHLISANENGSHTQLKFERQFQTCDPHDIQINDDQIKLIWAIGNTDKIEKHQMKGMKSFNLLDPPFSPVDHSAYDHWTIQVDSKIPNDKGTNYWCTMHKAPNFKNKTHIVGFQVILENEKALEHTHHIVLHKCHNPARNEKDALQWTSRMESLLTDEGGECYQGDHPIRALYGDCLTYFFVYSKGGNSFDLPEDVGIPIGESGQEEFFVMETHYDHPKFAQTPKNSIKYKIGMHIFYTKPTAPLRQHDVGMLAVGHEIQINHVIPPGSTNFVTVGHCSSTCTEEALPQDGVKIFNVLLHAHLSGRKLNLRHFRGNQELPWIASDNNYNFDYQQTRLLPKEVLLMKGDHLSIDCAYDTTWMSPPSGTFGGFSTRHEMCSAYFMYYPKVKSLTMCGSLNNRWEYIFKTFGTQNITTDNMESPIVTAPTSMAGMTYLDAINKVNWTQELRDQFQQELRYTDHWASCRAGELMPNDNETWWTGKTNYPKVSKFYEPPNLCSNAQSIHLNFSLVIVTLFYCLFI